MTEVEKVFRKFDANGDGKTSLSKLAKFMCALSGSQAASDLDIDWMMADMDVDVDGFVDLKN